MPLEMRKDSRPRKMTGFDEIENKSSQVANLIIGYREEGLLC